MSLTADRAQHAMSIAKGISDLDVRAVRSVYGRYLAMPLDFDQEYEDLLGETRIDITQEGHAALCDAVGGECPHCGRAVAEGELH